MKDLYLEISYNLNQIIKIIIIIIRDNDKDNNVIEIDVFLYSQSHLLRQKSLS